MREQPSEISNSWVLTYRDLCEWGVLYHLICYKGFTHNTVIVKDGLLRSKIFKYNAATGKALFIEMMTRINQAIDTNYNKKKIKIFFVGLAKHSQVLTRYSLAIQLENIFPAGEPRYAKVPEIMEKSSYVWKEYMRKSDSEEGVGEVNKYSSGSLFLVRFGKKKSDPIWAIDLLDNQKNMADEIFGYLYMDTLDAFPIPHYPSCLQKALEHAQIVDFDLNLLQDQVVKAVKNILPSDKKDIIDYQNLSNPSISNRQ